MHICRIFPEQSRAEAERLFQNPEILDSASLHHEAILLLQAVFPSLSAETQQHLLAWMDAGPSQESARRWLEAVGEEVTDEKIRQYVDQERRDHFSIIDGQLPEPYRIKYDGLKLELGAPNPPESISTPQFGAISAQSPKSAEELGEMPVGGMLDFLTSWAPGRDIFGPTADGLGGTLAGVVSERPAEFASVAERFKPLDPTYVRCFFGGLNTAVKQGKKWDWRPVLELSSWVVSQPREIEGRKSGRMVADPDWGWTRDAVIDLLSSGFEAVKDRPPDDRLPYNQRPLVWEVLRPLTEDPKLSPADEMGEKFDPAFLSINSTRGRAIDAVVDYAWWVRRCMDAERRAAGAPPVTFEVMPEVREVLDAHLDLQIEPTLSIRSVYGRHLTSLASLDWDWFRANVDRILQPDRTTRLASIPPGRVSLVSISHILFCCRC